MGKGWTKNEIDMLQALTDQGCTDREIAKELNRTDMSIKSKRHELKLYKHRKKKTSHVKRVYWTDAEDKKLIEMYNKYYDYQDIAQQLGRTKNSIIGRLHKLRNGKIKKKEQGIVHLGAIREYTDTSNMLITQFVDEGKTIEEISEILDREINDLKNHIERMKKDGIFERERRLMEIYHRTRVPIDRTQIVKRGGLF